MRALLLTTVGAVLLAAAPTAAQAKAKLCDNRPGQTIAASSTARVYKDVTVPEVPVVRGCRHGSRTSVRLALDNDCDDTGALDQLVLAGRFVALTLVTCDTRTGATSVLLYDLRSGRNVLGTTAYSGDTPAATTVTELAVSPAGALAWIGRTAPAGGQVGEELHVMAPGSTTPTVIDQQTGDGSLTDIALTTHKVYWLRQSVTESMDLTAVVPT